MRAPPPGSTDSPLLTDGVAHVLGAHVLVRVQDGGGGQVVDDPVVVVLALDGLRAVGEGTRDVRGEQRGVRKQFGCWRRFRAHTPA